MTSIDTKLSDNQRQVFESKDILCKIISFVDWLTLRDVELVSNEWNNAAKDPSSRTHLNFEDCYQCLNYRRQKYRCLDSILRFKHIHTLIFPVTKIINDMEQFKKYMQRRPKTQRMFADSTSKLSKYCKELASFNKIQHLHLSIDRITDRDNESRDYVNLEPLLSAIKENAQQLKHLSMDVWRICHGDRRYLSILPFRIDDFGPLEKFIVEPIYNNLEILDLCGFRIHYQSYPVLHYPSLKHLKLSVIYFTTTMDEWHELVKNESMQTSLMQLKSLYLSDIEIDDFQRFHEEIVPKIAKYLINLEKITVVPHDRTIASIQHPYKKDIDPNIRPEYDMYLGLIHQISTNQLNHFNQNKLAEIDNSDGNAYNYNGMDVCIECDKHCFKFDEKFESKYNFDETNIPKLKLKGLNHIESTAEQIMKIFGKRLCQLKINAILSEHFRLSIKLIEKLSVSQQFKRLKSIELFLKHPFGHPGYGGFLCNIFGSIFLINKGADIEPYIRIHYQGGLSRDAINQIVDIFSQRFDTRLMHFSLFYERYRQYVEFERYQQFEKISLSQQGKKQILEKCQQRNDGLKFDPLVTVGRFLEKYLVIVRNSSLSDDV